MKKVNNCAVENCIPTQSSCVEWNGGSIEYLGICNGDSLNTLLWEVITKLQDIAGEDLSQFDIDSLLDICNQQAPSEVTIISILNLIKNNQVCLKDYIDNLNDRLNDLFRESSVNINLRCYAEFDNLGNSLSITRDQLDQLVIDNLCNHKLRIETLEGKTTSLQSQIDNLDIPDTTEPSLSTCVNPAVLPASSQIISVAKELCDLQNATGDPTDIANALSQTPGDLNSEFGLITGWILTPSTWAEDYNNMKLMVESLRQRILHMESTCCKLTCADVKIGFSAVYNEDGDGIILRFTYGAGTSIPSGFEDGGSTGTITDIDGNTVDFNITIANNAEEEIIITGLNTLGDLAININAIMQTEGLICQKCVSRVIKPSQQCAYCTLTASGTSGSVVIVYESSQSYGTTDGQVIVIEESTTSTTTSNE